MKKVFFFGVIAYSAAIFLLNDLPAATGYTGTAALRQSVNLNAPFSRNWRDQMSERVKLMQRAGRDLCTELLPAPFKLWYSDHSTGCQMTIVADVDNAQVPVWRGSIWYSSIYDFNECGKISGLQPDFAFAKDVIDKYFADLQSSVDARLRARDERLAKEAAAAQERKTVGIEAIRRQIEGASAH